MNLNLPNLPLGVVATKLRASCEPDEYELVGHDPYQIYKGGRSAGNTRVIVEPAPGWRFAYDIARNCYAAAKIALNMPNLIHDPTKCKLGRRPTIHVPGMKTIAQLTATLNLPTPPEAVAWYKGKVTSWGMDGNDLYGDCVFAGSAHAEQLWSTVVGTPNVPTTEQVLAAYTKFTGFNPADPNTDNGAVESDTLTKWQSEGMFGSNLIGSISVNPKVQNQVKDAVWFFGCAMLGLELPNSAQNQDVWDVPPGGVTGDGAPGSWGGHCTLLVGAGARGVTMVTWGALKTATWEFMAAYCSEAYAMLSPDWIDKSGIDAGGVPLASLKADLFKVSSVS